MSFRVLNPRSNGATLGVDIGHDFIKVVEAHPTREGVEVRAACMAPTPTGAVVDGVIVDPDALGDALHALGKERGLSGHRAVTAVSGPQVNVRPIPMPQMSDADVRKSIVWEAQKHFSFTPEETIVEAEALRSDAGDPSEMYVMVVTAPRTQVEGHQIALEAAGLEPVAVEVGVFAKVRTLLEIPERQEDLDRTLAVVDMGGSFTEVAIIQAGLPVWMRVIPLGGSTLTKALAEALGLEWSEAVSAKEAMDAVKLGAAEDLSTAEAYVQPSLEELMREVRRSVNFYNSQTESNGESAAVEKVLLVGGTARMAQMGAYLREALRLEVVVGELPVCPRLACRPEAEEELTHSFPSYAQATGLAAWEALSRISKRQGK